MQRLASTTVTAVKSHTGIVGIIQDYIKLKKRGRNWIGLCPFHSERTPSFTVSPDKMLWHCFGCHESGDTIGFVMKVDHLGFSEAVEHIALKVGIPVEWEERSPDDSARDGLLNRLREHLAMARDFYRSQFDSSGARSYVVNRGVAEDVARRFSLGYSSSSEGIVRFLRSKGLSDETIMDLGVAVVVNGRLIDRFSERLVFPIMDERGRTIGFGGRVLSDSSHGPKYINSDETPVFNKRRVLYGIDLAKTAIRKMGCAVVMEGYMDVVTAHQFGFCQSVAALGTAFSLDHARILSRLCSTVVTALDQDSAGQSATDRVFDHCSAVGITLKVATFSGKDPADCLIQYGTEYFEERLASAVSYAEYKFKHLVADYPIDRIENVSKIVDSMVPILSKESDTVVQRHYVRRMATFLKIEPELILARLSGTAYSPLAKRYYAPSLPRKSKLHLAEEQIIYLMATSLVDRIRVFESLKIADFRSPEHQAIAQLLCESPLVNRDLLDAISDESHRKLLGRLLVERAADSPGSLDECISLLRRVPTEERITLIKARLKEIDRDGLDMDDEVDALLRELQSLIRGSDGS